MTASEIEGALRRYRARLHALLSEREREHYEQYQQEVQDRLAAHQPAPVEVSPEVQAVLDKIAADPEAEALNRQFMALIGVEKLPQ